MKLSKLLDRCPMEECRNNLYAVGFSLEKKIIIYRCSECGCFIYDMKEISIKKIGKEDLPEFTLFRHSLNPRELRKHLRNPN